jgi:hypothetical protein
MAHGRMSPIAHLLRKHDFKNILRAGTILLPDARGSVASDETMTKTQNRSFILDYPQKFRYYAARTYFMVV